MFSGIIISVINAYTSHNSYQPEDKDFDHLSQDTGDWDIGRTWSYSSEGNFVDKLNKELRMVGVKI